MFGGFGTELAAEAVQITENAPVDHADQAVKLEQGILQRCRRQQHFTGNVCQRFFQGFADNIAFFVDVAQAVRFVHHHQMPADCLDVFRFGFGKLVGTDNRHILAERVAAFFFQGVIAFGFQNHALQAEFFLQFLMPLFAQVGGGDNQNMALALRPALQNHQTGLNGFTQADLIRQNHAVRQRILAGKQGGIDLMRIQIHLRIDQRARQRIHAAALCLTGEQPSVVLGLVRSELGQVLHAVILFPYSRCAHGKHRYG